MAARVVSGTTATIRHVISVKNRGNYSISGLHLATASTVWGTYDAPDRARLSARLHYKPKKQKGKQRMKATTQVIDSHNDAIIGGDQKPVSPVRQKIASYINLIKPHVTVLLLGTTLAAMAIAGKGQPGMGMTLPLVLATLLGGAMAAGSANCINCYIDRDIDQMMGRTQRRSIPAGKVSPRQALLFGIALGVVSFLLLALF